MQHWDPDRYAREAAFVPALGAAVVDWLDPQRGERVLDLGCGNGTLTQQLAAAGCEVVAVDASGEQVAAARRAGLDARVADGHKLDFECEFNAVFSNAALHWMRRPAEVIAGVRRALKPGGRFVGELGGAGNVATVVKALETVLARHGIDAGPLCPWYFPAVEEYRQRLEDGGFQVTAIESFARPTRLPGDLAGWLETFAETYLRAAPHVPRAVLLEETAAFVEPQLKRTEGWFVDYVRLRFRAELQE